MIVYFFSNLLSVYMDICGGQSNYIWLHQVIIIHIGNRFFNEEIINNLHMAVLVFTQLRIITHLCFVLAGRINVEWDLKVIIGDNNIL